MATLRTVLARHDEKLNVKNALLCVALVVILVSFAFGLMNMKLLFQDTPDQNRVEPTAGEVKPSN